MSVQAFTRPACLCTHRVDIRCEEGHCDIAGPGEPNNPNQCRICWIRLGKPAVVGPNVWRMAWNYTQAVFHHVRRGAPIASEEDATERYSLCLACDYYDAERDSCAKCGCNMRQKVGLASMKCGHNPPKWTECEPVKDKSLLQGLLAILPFGKR